MRTLLILAAGAAALAFSGCASSSGVRNPSGVPVTEMRPDERGFVAGTGIESQDLVAVTDQIARRILSTPQIAQAQGTPRVVILPVQNQTRFPINQDIFTTRIRAQLNSRSQGRVLFLARDRIDALQREQQLKQSGLVTSSSDPNAIEFRGADFFLTGTLQGMTTRTRAGVSDFVLYTFQLIDARTSDIIFEDFAEVKRQGLDDAVYR